MLVVSKVCAGEYGAEGLEKEARDAKKGLWVDPAPIPPWVFRKAKRGQAIDLSDMVPLDAQTERVAASHHRHVEIATTALTDSPRQQLLLVTVVYSLSIRTAVAVTTPKRTEESPPDVNIAGSGGMAPLRINIEPRAPIWPTHLAPVIT